MRIGSAFVILLGLLSGACASNPDVVITHYRPQGSISLQAVRTVGCSGEGDTRRIHVATAVTATPIYARNDHDRDTIELTALDSRTANSSLSVTFTEDGRLKGVNSTSTGVGQEIVQSAIKIAGILLPAVLALDGSQTPENGCGLIADLAPKDKILTLTYALTEDFMRDDHVGEVPAVAQPFILASGFNRLEAVNAHVPALCAIMTRGTQIDPVAAVRRPEGHVASPEDGLTEISLRQPVPVTVEVVQQADDGAAGNCEGIPERAEGVRTGWQDIWRGVVQVPQIGRTYDVPIPTAALFGGNTFELALAESGAITRIGYGLTSGASGVAGAAVAAADALAPSTTAQRAAEVKAQADLIQQQQRLIRCEMNPADCS